MGVALTVIWNDASGQRNVDNRSEERRVRDRMEERGAMLQLVRAPGSALAAVARRALEMGQDAIVAAGGDGTVGAIASAIAGSRIPLGILPLGTFNHFAVDAGIPRDLDAAVDVVMAGRGRQVDVAEVNGRVFVNNASLGFYPAFADRREALRREGRLGAVASMLLPALALFRKMPTLSVRLSTGGASVCRDTTFVAVGNDPYALDLYDPIGRPSLDRGTLGLYLARRPGRLALLAIALRALVGRIDQARDLEVHIAPEVLVESRHPLLRIALDGETTWLAPPLRFRSRARALSLLVPDAPP